MCCSPTPEWRPSSRWRRPHPIGTHGTAHWFWLGLSVLLLSSATLARQNALLALVLVLLCLIRRGQDADIAVAALLGAALVFALSFLAISIACDCRYLYFLDLAAMTVRSGLPQAG